MPMVHEILGLNVSTHPFVPLTDLLTNHGGKQHRAVNLAALDPYNARGREAGIWEWEAVVSGVGSGSGSARPSDQTQDMDKRAMLLSLAVKIMIEPQWRNPYLADVVPLAEASAHKATKKLRGVDEVERGRRERAARAQATEQWCSRS